MKKGAKATEEELITFVQERLAEYKKIREIEFVKTLPRNASGKVLRRVFIQRERELANARADSMKVFNLYDNILG